MAEGECLGVLERGEAKRKAGPPSSEGVEVASPAQQRHCNTGIKPAHTPNGWSLPGQNGGCGRGDVCFDAGLEGTGGRGARLPASSTRGGTEPMAGLGRRDGTERKNGAAPPPRSAGPPEPRIVSEDRERVHAHSGPSSRRKTEHEEARRP